MGFNLHDDRISHTKKHSNTFPSEVIGDLA